MNLTPKQEAFCQAIVAGENQSEAYRIAYDAKNMAPATVNKRAYDLMRNGYVTGRVKELRAPVVEAVRYGLNEAMGEAEKALTMAQAQGNTSVMVAATALRAKLSGLLAEKPAVVLNALEAASTEVLLAMLAEYERRHAARELTHADHA